jgi:hypothetical protein
LRHCAAFNVEGISQATAAFFFFQFFVYDFAGMGFESYGPRLSDADFCTLREFLAGVRHRWQSRRKQPQRCSGGEPEPHHLRHDWTSVMGMRRFYELNALLWRRSQPTTFSFWRERETLVM